MRPLYNLLYNATIEWHPGFCYCIAATLLLIYIAVVMVIVAYKDIPTRREKKKLKVLNK